MTVGGSGVGGALLRRVIEAYPAARERVPELRMIVVAGPRIDPASLPAAPRARGPGLRAGPLPPPRGLRPRGRAGRADDLDGADRQRGGRSSYFPLRHHFEQSLHVAHRLERHGAGRRMDFETATPDVIADAIAAEIGREVAYRPVDGGGAARAAAMLAELL